MAEDLQLQSIQIKQVPAANAWAWIVGGFNLFKANPAMWLILFVIYLLIIVPISLIPVIGSILSALLAPVFAAGLMWGCKAVDLDQDLEINHLFAGFKKNTAQLIMLGGIYMASSLIIAVMVVLTLDRDTLSILKQGGTVSPEQANAMMLPILVAILFVIPVLMASWFAPVLVGLNNLTAFDALKQSFTACLKNMLPFILYSLISTGLLIVAITPFGLGLLVLVPVMMITVYTSYADIFSITESAI